MNFKDIHQQIADVAANYQYTKTPDLVIRIQELIRKFLRWLSDLLSAFQIQTPGLTDSRFASNVLQVLLWVIGGLCLVFLLVSVWNRLTQLKAQSELARKNQTRSGKLLDANEWQAEAQRLAQQEHWREASRAIYCAALHLLDERKILEFSPTKTNHEYWYALIAKPNLAKDFRKLSNLVECLWFGNQQASQTEFQISKDLFAAIDKSTVVNDSSGTTGSHLN